jgi:excisionase family DNA binding protein
MELEGAELLTSAETAELLRVPVRTLYVWRGAGNGPRAYRVGKHVLYRRRDVEAWLEERCVPASTGASP